MVMTSLIISLLGVAAAVQPRVGYELDAVPPDAREGWTRKERADPALKLQLHFLLHQQGVESLEATLLAVSDPASSRYGQHLSLAQVNELTAPSELAKRSMRAFLAIHGVTPDRESSNGDMLEITVPVSVAERLLGCEYYIYQHTDGTQATRTPTYTLPHHLQNVIAAVAPTVRLPTRRVTNRLATPGVARPGALVNTPASLRKLYSVGSVQGRAPSNKQAVTAFLEQRFSPADLESFYALLLNGTEFKDATRRTITLKGDDGGKSAFGGTESMLDIEYITSLGANISSEFWGFAGRSPDNPENEPFLKWLAMLGNTSDAEVPKVFSTSYGEDEVSVSAAYADRINVEFMKAGARGISLLFASGDSGAAGDHGCIGGQFVPQWPAASPYVTAVGGTAGLGTETAVGLSSGGFSGRYARPTWQEAAVNEYLSTATLPDPKYINSTAGRGFPDISAQAVNYIVVSLRIPLPVAGTSCASPTAAGVFGLINDALVQAGKPTLGFLNPFLYSSAAALNDVVSGSNQGCGFDPGYPAVKGWDAVTGLGTPNYVKLVQAALSSGSSKVQTA